MIKKSISKRSTAKSSKSPKLFWVSDDCNSEDWFVIANNVRQAKKFYADSEGMNDSDVDDAELLINIPISLLKNEHTGESEDVPDYPSHSLLRKLGFRKVPATHFNLINSETMVYKGRKFKMGCVLNSFLDKMPKMKSEPCDVIKAVEKDLVNKFQSLPMNLKVFYVIFSDSSSFSYQFMVIARNKEEASKFCLVINENYDDKIICQEIVAVQKEKYDQYYNKLRFPMRHILIFYLTLALS